MQTASVLTAVSVIGKLTGESLFVLMITEVGFKVEAFDLRHQNLKECLMLLGELSVMMTGLKSSTSTLTSQNICSGGENFFRKFFNNKK